MSVASGICPEAKVCTQIPAPGERTWPGLSGWPHPAQLLWLPAASPLPTSSASVGTLRPWVPAGPSQAVITPLPAVVVQVAVGRRLCGARGCPVPRVLTAWGRGHTHLISGGPRAAGLTWAVPQDTWQCPAVTLREGMVLLATKGWKPGMLLSTRQGPGQPAGRPQPRMPTVPGLGL